MSFQNFESFQNQHPAADAAAAASGAPAPADTAMTGQADPATAPFQGPPAPDATAAPVQQVGDGKTTLWYVSMCCPCEPVSNNSYRMGELEPWIDENFVRNLWFQMGEQVNVKMIRDKFSG